ncbi:phosphate-starvation-inducible PsiE family protein [Pedosphaera parvula]|uniref:Diguanylate cyclase n=1 Tax=Pedosphaera parvula (strain Ellin514) TaxID=320771 RepID=B9XJ96_PEDPL|nr:phosphate-starvation-inducible PsiE family protein [Pedosphaera parvula]EEF60134.1 conserved hypothetical protein [Pedosphaera parvula Ellin514]
MKPFFTRWFVVVDKWPGLTIYQRFESLIALVLSFAISLIILMGLWQVLREVFEKLVLQSSNPLDPKTFQILFGDILTVLIALEFNHTLHYVVTREQSVIQTKIVLLISILALARKLIIMDLKETQPNQLLGLAAITLALGITYWLLRERVDRLATLPQKQSANLTPTEP